MLSLLVSSPALATTGYAFADQLGGAGNGPGEFTGGFAGGGPAGIAIRQSTGDVFVSDPAHTLADGTTLDPRIERFDASGAFQSAFSIEAGYHSPGALAVAPAGSGSVYVGVTDASMGGAAVLKYSAAGGFAYALDTSTSGIAINAGAGVAVDPVSGDVFVTAVEVDGGGRQVVAVFDGGSGALIASLDGSSSPEAGFVCPSSLAVDGASRLYVVDQCKGRVDRYSTAGVFGGVVDDGSRGAPYGVTADPISNEVFVAESGNTGLLQVTQFTAGGVSAGQSFGPPQIASFAGLAVNHSPGAVYVADLAKAVVERFIRFEGPTVTTTTSVSIDPTSETLNGTIDPGGVSSTYHFEYGPDTSYGARTAESAPVTGSGEIPATAIATGLNPNATYHFRIVGSNASGSIAGNDQTFTTPAAPPLLDGSPAFASSITTTGATLNATLNPNGSNTTYRFEYGTAGPCDAHPCASTAAAGAGAGHGDQPVTVDLTGLLTASTTYHYRLVADNGTGGVQHGADGLFSTAPATPASAHNVTAFGADLHGVINPHGAPTTYHFEYGNTTAYGRTTPETDGGSSSGEETVGHATGRLSPATTYHFRIVATSNGQTTTSDDATFTTGEIPVAVATYPTAISTSEATLGGQVDTHGAGGSYTFRVESLDGPYTTTTNAQQTPTGAGMKSVSTPLTGLPSGESFRVVLSVTSNQATTSDEIEFATAPLAKPPTRPSNPNTHSCTAPVLHHYDRHPQPGDTITITGRDLGPSGTATLAGKQIATSRWTTRKFSIKIPHRATGTLPLTIDCGQRSNTIAITIAPNNKFTIANTKINGQTAMLSLRLPGAGRIRTAGRRTSPKMTRIARAGTATIKIKLTNTAANTLTKAKTGRLETAVRVRFTPKGGRPATKTTTLVFKRATAKARD